jgi:hypothetical protein
MRISHVVKGKRPVTAEMALLFGKAFGQTPQYWINLQVTYDLKMAEKVVSREKIIRYSDLITLTCNIDSTMLAGMVKQEIIKIIRNSKPEMESHYGVQRLGLFGSYVKEKQRKKSDIDILVAFNRDIDLFDFLDLREFLESQLSIKVDLVMESALKPAIGKRILSEVEYV